METLSLAPRAGHVLPASEHTIYTPPAKPPRLIEKAQSSPLEVIIEAAPFIEDIRDCHLPQWLRTALINENGVYMECDQRQALIHFYGDLQLLIDALLAIANQHIMGEVLPPGCEQPGAPKLLNDEQLANPNAVAAAFCQKYPAEYARRELWHFLEAGVNYIGNYPGGFSAGLALLSYDYVSALVEAAYYLEAE